MVRISTQLCQSMGADTVHQHLVLSCVPIVDGDGRRVAMRSLVFFRCNAGVCQSKSNDKGQIRVENGLGESGGGNGGGRCRNGKNS